MIYSSWIPADPQGRRRAAAGASEARRQPRHLHEPVRRRLGGADLRLRRLLADVPGAGPGGPHRAGRRDARALLHPLLQLLASACATTCASAACPPPPGTTTLEVNGHELVATTRVDGVPIIRTRGPGRQQDRRRGPRPPHLRDAGGRQAHGRQLPLRGRARRSLRAASRSSSSPRTTRSARCGPRSPLQQVEGWCWFAPRDSFVYPGGEYE